MALTREGERGQSQNRGRGHECDFLSIIILQVCLMPDYTVKKVKENLVIVTSRLGMGKPFFTVYESLGD